MTNRRKEPGRMYKAICAYCGQECQVPFKPDQSIPVYCKKCKRERRTRYYRGPCF